MDRTSADKIMSIVQEIDDALERLSALTVSYDSPKEQGHVEKKINKCFDLNMRLFEHVAVQYPERERVRKVLLSALKRSYPEIVFSGDMHLKEISSSIWDAIDGPDYSWDISAVANNFGAKVPQSVWDKTYTIDEVIDAVYVHTPKEGRNIYQEKENKQKGKLGFFSAFFRKFR